MNEVSIKQLAAASQAANVTFTLRLQSIKIVS